MDSRNSAYQKPVLNEEEYKKRNDERSVNLRKKNRFEHFNRKRQLIREEEKDNWSVDQVFEIFP